MSQRIQELAAQAKKNVPHGLGVDKWIEVYNEKFAELIVRECANFVENIFDDDGGHAPCEDYAKGIKKHFGVEE